MATMSTKAHLSKVEDFVSVKRAGEMLGVTDGRIRQLVGNHEKHALKATRLGERSWMIAIADIVRYAKKNGIELNYGPKQG